MSVATIESRYDCKTYIKQRQRLHNNYFVVFRADFAMLTLHEIVLLSHLQNYAAATSDDEGWSWQSAKHVEKGTGLTADEQITNFTSLKNKGIVETRIDYDGGVKKRMIRVDCGQLTRFLAGEVKEAKRPSLGIFKPEKSSSHRPVMR